MRHVTFRSPRLIAAAASACIIAACADAEHPRCTQATVVSALPTALGEASGIAVSTARPDVLWVHNDSEGSPALHAIDRNGAVIAEIAVMGVGAQQDWEDLATGPCPTGSCIYIGDIGDNYHRRDDRAILRLPEPDPMATRGGPIERFPIRYPDGPQDAEALFVMPDTTAWIISKGRDGAVTLYRYPPPFRSGERVTLELVQRLTDGLVQLPGLVTGAAAAVDGSRIAVRTYSGLRMYRFDGDTLAPTWPEPGFALDHLAEPQGEGVALAGADTVYLVSEAGPFGTEAPLSRLICPPR